MARDPTRSSQNHAFLYWAMPNNLFSVSPPKIWVNFSTILIRSRVLIFESYYSATDAEFGIPNNEFKLQIPLLGYYLDAKSNLVHITRTQPHKAIDRGRQFEKAMGTNPTSTCNCKNVRCHKLPCCKD